jgi:hypothetical protein
LREHQRLKSQLSVHIQMVRDGEEALQLAASLEWCEDVPQSWFRLTADQKLREAAVLNGVGFTTSSNSAINRSD